MATVALARPTPAASLNPSRSQTSAPVFEYRCMFTHDVRKKAKKWHDGSLRFHTFNRRVMVYDDAKNLVGSLHYRSQDEFTEGLELNLDSHVLVQVEERLGESSTDLTPLLSRQKQDGSSQGPGSDVPTRANLPRINAANTQIKPKSIKELLASSQGTLGRARLPLKSPFEQRNLAENHPIESEPKRRKIDHGKENVVDITATSEPGVKSVSLELMFTAAAECSVVGISSDEAPSPPPKTRRRTQLNAANPNVVHGPSSTSVPQNFTEDVPTLTDDVDPERRRSSKASTNAHFHASSRRGQLPNAKDSSKRRKDHNVTVLQSASARSTAAANPSSRGQTHHATGPRSSLKFPVEKPRLKLMYRALLDSTSTSAGRTPARTTIDALSDQEHQKSRIDVERVKRRSRPTTLFDLDRMLDSSQTGEEPEVVSKESAVDTVMSNHVDKEGSADCENPPVSPCQVSSPEASSMPADIIVEAVPDSPLFLPQPTSQVSPPASHNTMLDENVVSLLSQGLRNTTRIVEGEMIRPSPQPRSDRHDNIPSLTSSPDFQRLISIQQLDLEPRVEVRASPIPELEGRASTLLSLLPLLPPPLVPHIDKRTTPKPSPILPAQVRPFRRVVSESIRPIYASPDESFDSIDDEDGRPDSMTLDKHHTNFLPSRHDLGADPQSISDPVDIHVTSPVARAVSSSPNVSANERQSGAQIIPHAPSTALEPTDAAYIPAEDSGPWTSTEAFLLFDRWPPGRQKPPYATDTLPITSATNGENLGMNLMSKKKYGTFGSAKFVSQR